MLKFISSLFKKKSQGIESVLLYPDGKRYYRDSHPIRKQNIDEDALKIIHRLNRFNHKAFLVGGSIRDILLGKKPKDFDIATSATPNQIKSIFNNCRIIGKRFKIVHVIFKGKIIEVSTFRSLPEHRLEPKKMNESKELLLKRDNNYGTTKEDAARRDFTINSLYFDTRNESIIDYVGGFEDIQRKIVKVIGDPDISFKEDPVRMLRAVKFQSLHNLELEKNTKISIKKNRFELEKASTSRMLEEYNKIFRTWNTAKIFQSLAENHLFEVLFKEIAEGLKSVPNWQDNFLNTGVGKRLQVADRMLQEREELTSIIFFALIFFDLVNEVVKRESSKQNLVPSIKLALEPICKRLEIPGKDLERLIKIFASQKRFLQTNESNQNHNEVFRKKDFFYEAFMLFKIHAISVNDEKSIQSAFFWEISLRNRPKTALKTIHQEGNHKEKFKKTDRKFKKNNFHKNQNPNENQQPVVEKETSHSDNKSGIVEKVVKEESVQLESSTPISNELNETKTETNKETKKPFFKKKYRGRFRKFKKFPKNNSSTDNQSNNSNSNTNSSESGA
jgi:poly(A) polymerase